MSLAAIDNRIGRTSVLRRYDSSVPPQDGSSFCLHARRVEQPGQDRSFTVRVVTEPAATGPSPGATGPSGTLPYAGQVVRRVLLRRNIVIDAETAQLVAAAVQAALQAGEPSRRPGRGPRVPGVGCAPPS
jgi:hypothetical protein